MKHTLYESEIYINFFVIYKSAHDKPNSAELNCPLGLRIPDSYDAKIERNCNICTFRHVIQLIKDGLLAELQARMSRFLLFFLS